LKHEQEQQTRHLTDIRQIRFNVIKPQHYEQHPAKISSRPSSSHPQSVPHAYLITPARIISTTSRNNNHAYSTSSGEETQQDESFLSPMSNIEGIRSPRGGGGSHNHAIESDEEDDVPPHHPSGEQQRMILLQTRHRFQFIVTSIALVFSLLLFAILICWVVFTSAYIVSIDKTCDVPLKNYYWWATIQLILDVFRADIMKFCCCHPPLVVTTTSSMAPLSSPQHGRGGRNNVAEIDRSSGTHTTGQYSPNATRDNAASSIRENHSNQHTPQRRLPPSSTSEVRVIPVRVTIYNIVYFCYALWVMDLGCSSVFYDSSKSEGPTCRDTIPELYASSSAFCVLSLCAWATIVLGYLVPICYWTYVGGAGAGGGGARGFLYHLAASPGVSPAPPSLVPQSFAHYVPYLPLVSLRDPEFVSGMYPKDCCICMNDFHAADGSSASVLPSVTSSILCDEEEDERENNEGNDNNVIVVTPCRHIFHRQCCLEWMELSRTCPVCRTDLVDALQLHHHGQQCRDSNNDAAENADSHSNRHVVRSVGEISRSINTDHYISGVGMAHVHRQGQAMSTRTGLPLEQSTSSPSPLGLVREMWSMPRWLLSQRHQQRLRQRQREGRTVGDPILDNEEDDNSSSVSDHETSDGNDHGDNHATVCSNRTGASARSSSVGDG
jgi:hypothetical protein